MLGSHQFVPRRPEPGDEIEVRCRCGHRDIWTRDHSHPPGAARAQLRGCPECRGRGPVGVQFYDTAGRPVH